MRDKIKVLFLAADPFDDRAPLELKREMDAVRQALRQGRARDTLELVSHVGTRTGDLQRALLWHQPQIVHFAGHGGASGVIYLGDEHGRPRAVDKEVLGGLFRILADEVRVVVLNACSTRLVVEALRDAVDYAIGTSRRISDESALVFSQGFYTALAAGRGVEQAFDLAVNQLHLEESPDADVPMLRVRIGADEAPLLSASAGARAREERGAAVDIDQSPTMGPIRDSQVNIVGVDRQAPGGGRRTVRQNPTIESMTNVNFSLVGERTGAPPPRE